MEKPFLRFKRLSKEGVWYISSCMVVMRTRIESGMMNRLKGAQSASLVFLDFFYLLILKTKIYYFNIFLNKKYFKKQRYIIIIYYSLKYRINIKCMSLIDQIYKRIYNGYHLICLISCVNYLQLGWFFYYYSFFMVGYFLLLMS